MSPAWAKGLHGTDIALHVLGLLERDARVFPMVCVMTEPPVAIERFKNGIPRSTMVIYALRRYRRPTLSTGPFPNKARSVRATRSEAMLGARLASGSLYLTKFRGALQGAHASLFGVGTADRIDHLWNPAAPPRAAPDELWPGTDRPPISLGFVPGTAG